MPLDPVKVRFWRAASPRTDDGVLPTGDGPVHALAVAKNAWLAAATPMAAAAVCASWRGQKPFVANVLRWLRGNSVRRRDGRDAAHGRC